MSWQRPSQPGAGGISSYRRTFIIPCPSKKERCPLLYPLLSSSRTRVKRERPSAGNTSSQRKRKLWFTFCYRPPAVCHDQTNQAFRQKLGSGLRETHWELKARRVRTIDWKHYENKIYYKIKVIGKVLKDPAIRPENVYNMVGPCSLL